MNVALGEEEILFVLGVDVRDAPAIPYDLHSLKRETSTSLYVSRFTFDV